ncbi:hypothetical protein ACFS07_36290 [Undibacterium arcticum]
MLFQRLKLKIMSMLLLGTMAICAAIFAAYVGYGLICEARSPVVGGILILGVFTLPRRGVRNDVDRYGGFLAVQSIRSYGGKLVKLSAHMIQSEM